MTDSSPAPEAPDSALAASVDIAVRNQLEASLRDLAERSDAIIATTTDGYWELDGQGRILDVNDEACRMYGYSREEILGLSVADFETRQTPPEIQRTIAQVQERGAMRFEVRHRCRDGRLLDIEVSTTYRRRAGRFLVLLRDVTARKQGESQLQESLEFSRTILASLVDRIVILDRHGAIIAVNGAWERFALDHGGPEVLARAGLGVNYLEVCHSAAALAALEGVESVLSGRIGFYRSEYSSETPKATYWYLMDVMPFRRAEGGAVVLHRDITAHRRAEEELQRLRQDIWHAHRVAQTGAIAASLAHELNQPLTAILSNAQAGARLLARPDVDLDEIRAILADIVHDDNRAAGVIVGLRAMLRRQATQRERIDLARTIQDVLALTRNELLAQEVIVDVHAPSECLLWADRVQIQQVVLNLVMNAIEAMETTPSEHRRLEISLTTTAAREAQLAVRDRGPGISEDGQAKAFDSFWTTKPKGMGIGLPISRSIIESHGGHLWFVNNEDRGVAFYFTLPLRSDRRSS